MTLEEFLDELIDARSALDGEGGRRRVAQFVHEVVASVGPTDDRGARVYVEDRLRMLLAWDSLSRLRVFERAPRFSALSDEFVQMVHRADVFSTGDLLAWNWSFVPRREINPDDPLETALRTMPSILESRLSEWMPILREGLEDAVDQGKPLDSELTDWEEFGR